MTDPTLLVKKGDPQDERNSLWVGDIIILLAKYIRLLAENHLPLDIICQIYVY
jgi:hypothetical protein